MPRPKPADPTISHGVRAKKSLWVRIDELARKFGITRNKWIVKVLTREAFKHGGKK